MAKRILVVEDNDLNRKLFCDVLKANGHEVVPVADGRNVVATAQRFVPDLVIMDIQLPHVSGIDLIGQLKADAALAGGPVLAVTAYARKGDEERIRDAGAAGRAAPRPARRRRRGAAWRASTARACGGAWSCSGRWARRSASRA